MHPHTVHLLAEARIADLRREAGRHRSPGRRTPTRRAQ